MQSAIASRYSQPKLILRERNASYASQYFSRFPCIKRYALHLEHLIS
jgi:hypothetical protein